MLAEKHPQLISSPRALLYMSAQKNMIKRTLPIKTEPGSHTPIIRRKPVISSSQGKKMADKLISSSGRIR